MSYATLTSSDDTPEIASPPSTEPGDVDFLAIRRKVGKALFPGADLPASIRRFRILERLGAGAMGTVYSAWDPELERRVAIKVLAWHASSSKRMTREAKALARLNHPNVVTVHEVGTVGERVFVAMEFVRGRTLGRLIEQGATAREKIDLYLQAAAGLAAAHDAGLVHRDFKPENVMVGEDGRVRVLDFGLARPAGALPPDGGEDDAAIKQMPIEALTRTGALIGTPAYMAPEQLVGAPAEAKSDQFAWCVCVWEALTGRRPWEAETLGELVGKINETEPAVAKGSSLSGALRRVLLRGLAVDPEARWPDMKRLAAEVRRAGRRPVLPALVAGCLATVIGAGVTALVVAGAPSRACDDLEPVWTDAAAQTLAETDASAGSVREFGEAMDRWSERFSSTRAAACAGDSEAHQKARACIEDLYTQAQGLVAAYTTEPVERFDDRTGPFPLDEPFLCRPEGPGTGLPPVPPEVAQDVARTRLQIEREYFRHSDHLYVDGQDDPDAAPAAKATGYGPLVAEALFADAVRRRYRSQHEEAERRAKDAIEAAEAVGHDVIVAKARLLITELALAAGRADALVATLADEADRAVERIHPDRRSIADRLRLDFALLLTGSRDEALAAKATTNFEAALRGLPDGTSMRAEALTSLARHLEKIGAAEEAARRRAEVVEIRRALVDAAEEGPQRGHARSMLANALSHADAVEEAIEQERLAIAVAESPFSVKLSHSNIGTWALELGRIDEAEEAFTQAAAVELKQDKTRVAIGAELGLARVAIARDDLPAAEKRLAAVLAHTYSAYIGMLLAWSQIARGDAEAALRSARKAYDEERMRYDTEDAGLGDARLVLATAHVASSAHDEAIALLDHDYVLERDDDGYARRVLGLALAGLGRDEQRAAELRSAGAAARQDARHRMVRRTEQDLIDRALARVAAH